MSAKEATVAWVVLGAVGLLAVAIAIASAVMWGEP